MWEYTEKVKEHFLQPHNVGEVEKPDAVGEVGSIACGDALKLTLKIDPKTGRILEAKFKTYGCGSAIASSSVLTDMVIGKTIEEAKKITNEDIVQVLGGLPKEKMHCSVMGQEALAAALSRYEGKDATVHQEEEGRLVCRCFAVPEGMIRRVARQNNLRTVEEVTQYTKAGGGCGACVTDIEDILHDLWGGKAVALSGDTASPALPQKKLTTVQKIRLIEETLEQVVRPMLARDGGNVELVDVDGNRVTLRLTGHCRHCAGATITMRYLIEEKLRQHVSPELVVEEQR